MDLKQRLKHNLISVRQNSERLLEDFRTPEEWVFQVHPSCNHALWFAGHMATIDNFFLSLVAPEKALKLPDFQASFGMGSQPSSDPDRYPPPADVLETMRERRRTLLGVLDALGEDELDRKLPAGTPSFLSDVGSVFETAIWHEGQHSGQLTVARRALGHKPLR